MCLTLVILMTCLDMLPPATPVGVDEKNEGAPKDSVKIRVEIELTGTLTVTDNEVTIAAPKPDIEPADGEDKPKAQVWLLDLTRNKDLHKKAKELHGKRVLVTGTALLNSRPVKVSALPPIGTGTPTSEFVTALTVERKVRVSALEATE